MTDTSDHDLLIALNTKMDIILTLHTAQIADLQTRVTVLERREDTQSGAWAGAKWLWGVLAALPVGGLGYLFGHHN